MDVPIKKCSHKKHSEINAVIYCIECKRYFCNKCKNSHVDLFEDHHFCKVDKNEKEIFTGYCNENNHNWDLEYYCRTHNKLCCAACITKIEGEGKGQHSNCEICFLKDIIDEKKNKLNENINTLKNLYNKLDESINNLKRLFIGINNCKEELKLNIQNMFTKIRNAINEREEKLLNEVEEKYNKYFVNEDIINKTEKLPKKIKSALEKGKNINSGKNENLKLNVLINGCINVENSVKEINNIYSTLNKCNTNKDIEINFSLDKNDINKFIEEIKKFGGIIINEFNINSKIVHRRQIQVNNNNKYNSMNVIQQRKRNYNLNTYNHNINSNNNMINVNNNINININDYKKHKIIKNDNDLKILKIKNEISYEVLNKDKLKIEIQEGQNEAKLEIILKNNGTKQWPENKTKLIANEQKNLIGKNIELEPQNPNDIQKYITNFNELKTYPPGDYTASYYFEVDGKKYGDDIELDIIIKDKGGDEEEKYKLLVKEFRDEYTLSEELYSDEKLLQILKKHNFNVVEAFDSLFY